MKKSLIILFLLPLFSKAQDSIPTKDGKFFYEKVIKFQKPVSKDDLYILARKWFASIYKNNSKNAIEFEDKDAGEITGKSYIKYYIGFGRGYASSEQTISVSIRDSKCRIQIFDFKTKHITGTFPDEHIKDVAIEDIFYEYTNNKLSGRNKKILDGLNSNATLLIENFNKYMTTNQVNSDF